MIILFLKGIYQFVMLYSDIFSRCPQIWSSISKTTNIFWNILGSRYWLQSIRKNDTRNFRLFVYLWSYKDKSKFLFLETVQSSRNTFYSRTSHFLQKVLVSFFSSNISLYIGKNPVEKLYKVLEMKLKNVHSSQPKICFWENQI